MDVWELMLYLLPCVFGMFVKGYVNWVDVKNYVGSIVVSVFICICDESEGFLLCYLYLDPRKFKEFRGTAGYVRAGRMMVMYNLSLLA